LLKKENKMFHGTTILSVRRDNKVAIAGGRDNVHVHKLGEYRLITLERPYPHFKGHRIETTGDWENIKQQYGNRCPT
jgi:hypothetical protein